MWHSIMKQVSRSNERETCHPSDLLRSLCPRQDSNLRHPL